MVFSDAVINAKHHLFKKNKPKHHKEADRDITGDLNKPRKQIPQRKDELFQVVTKNKHGRLTKTTPSTLNLRRFLLKISKS